MMFKVRHRDFLIQTAAAWLLVSFLNIAAADGDAVDFARIDYDANRQPRALQLAIVRYEFADDNTGRSVDLISAVHVGDAGYYEALNEQFTRYDALLYELIAPEGTIIDSDTRASGPVSGMQKGLQNMLSLSFQLEEIDYTPDNFVHADLSPKEMSESMEERGESLYTYFWSLVYASVREIGRDPLGIKGYQAMHTAIRKDSNPMKVMMAFDFSDPTRYQNMLGTDSENAIIGARNERAIEVMLRELENGAQTLGIFYGLGHMPDLHRKMQELGMVPVATSWVDAWVL